MIRQVAFFTFILAFCMTQVIALGFSASSWIWTNEVAGGSAPIGSRAFRRSFVTPAGKSAVSANVILVVDDNYQLYINGAPIGAGSGWSSSQAYCLPLAPNFNLFAINATNVGGPAGVLAAIQVNYNDGSTDLIVSNSSWLYSTSVPVGFQQLGFNDTTWPAAIVEGPYGMPPWGTPTVPPAASLVPVSLTTASWTWTNEVSGGQAPAGARAFRKDITVPANATAIYATIFVTTDNLFTLYVQGNTIGLGQWLGTAEVYLVNLISASTINIAVLGTNTQGPAGLIAAVQVTMADYQCSSSLSFVTDSTWVYSLTTPSGWQYPGFDDSAWPGSVVEGPYGMQPWGPIAVNPGVWQDSTGATSGEPANQEEPTNQEPLHI